MTCPKDYALVEPRMDRVLTQYRESPKLLHLIRTYLRQAEETAQAICDLPSRFDIETAVGEQLTFLGKRLGWPRCHCICDVQPVFGFECEGVVQDYPIGGFCDDTVTWINCHDFGRGDICLNDDEFYRKFLKVRCYQKDALFDIDSLHAAIRIFWGDQALVLASDQGRVVIAPGRELSSVEKAVLQLYPRVLPVAPGIKIRFHFGSLPVFGFGTGWGGFCEPWLPDGAVIATEDDQYLVTENGDPIFTGPLTRGASWMCEVDVHPYDCV